MGVVGLEYYSISDKTRAIVNVLKPDSMPLVFSQLLEHYQYTV